MAEEERQAPVERAGVWTPERVEDRIGGVGEERIRVGNAEIDGRRNTTGKSSCRKIRRQSGAIKAGVTGASRIPVVLESRKKYAFEPLSTKAGYV